jgi:hypothetical protein
VRSSAAIPVGAEPPPSGAALEALVVAAGEASLEESLDQLLGSLREAAAARRALLFLRRPLTGGLGCAAADSAEGIAVTDPVDPALLAAAAEGEARASSEAAAAPVRILGHFAGVLYVDGCAHPPPLGLLSAAAVLLGLRVGLDRSRQLAGAASHVVAVAHASPRREPFDLTGCVAAAEQVFAPLAAQRGEDLRFGPVGGGLSVQGDAGLLGRGLDRLIEHVLGEARGPVQVEVQRTPPAITVCYATQDAPEALAQVLDPRGLPADLKRAGEAWDDGVLALARACLLRAGATLAARPMPGTLTFEIQLEPA